VRSTAGLGGSLPVEFDSGLKLYSDCMLLLWAAFLCAAARHSCVQLGAVTPSNSLMLCLQAKTGKAPYVVCGGALAVLIACHAVQQCMVHRIMQQDRQQSCWQGIAA
jgi:hypothetical protein